MVFTFNRVISAFTFGLLLGARMALADGPADNWVDQVRRIPKLGVDVSEADRKELTDGLESLHAKIEKLRASESPLAKKLLPDVLIFQRAVDQRCNSRNSSIRKRLASVRRCFSKVISGRINFWLVMRLGQCRRVSLSRGYISKIDQTVQPYGLVIPASYKFDGTDKHRLDFWFHGRGETLSEVNFINDRSKNVVRFLPRIRSSCILTDVIAANTNGTK